MYFYFCWGQEGSNRYYILRVRPNPLGGNEVVKLDRIPSKLTFVDWYFEVCLSDDLKDLCDMTEMVLKGGTEDKYVVSV